MQKVKVTAFHDTSSGFTIDFVREDGRAEKVSFAPRPDEIKDQNVYIAQCVVQYFGEGSTVLKN